jgi:WD40 repeat protein
MVRLLVTVVLGSALALGAAWYFGFLPTADEFDLPAQRGETNRTSAKADEVARQKPLYPPTAEALLQTAAPHQPGPDPIVIPECILQPVDKQEVASQKDGQLMFVGQEVLPGEASDPAKTFTVKIRVGDKETPITYRELDRAAIVRPGQLVALVDPTLALAELAGLRAKKVAAGADYKATEATYKESQAKVLRQERAVVGGGIAASSIEDRAAAILMRDRYLQEMFSKQEAIKLAQAEIDKAEAVYRLYQIKNDMPSAGIIKAVYRKRGDTVKPQEPIMQLYSLERLRAEGLADVQYLDRLQAKPRVSLEPVIVEGPWRRFLGHRGEITSVACAGLGPGFRVVSASEDKTVAVWDPGVKGGPVRILHHPEAVRVVACNADASGRHWCLTGCADGSIRLWDLDGTAPGPVWAQKDPDKGAYRGPVTALAFSPDGKFFASGGEDGMIRLWRTARGEMVYPFDAEHGVEHPHDGPVTSLHFTPQCRLVSASRDNSLRVWALKKQGAVALMDPRGIANRGGTVSALGVSRDGGKMLFDQGRRLQILSVPEGRTLCSVQGTFGSTPFETLALFSPDDSLLLTAGAPEGRMQLWRAPTAGGRAYEVRQLAPEEHAAVTSAAFAADGSFAASGTKDGTVYLWRMPTREQVEHHRIEGLSLTQVDRALDANARQVRIGVDVRNRVDAEHPFGRLMPGRPVTVVIEP